MLFRSPQNPHSSQSLPSSSSQRRTRQPTEPPLGNSAPGRARGPFHWIYRHLCLRGGGLTLLNKTDSCYHCPGRNSKPSAAPGRDWWISSAASASFRRNNSLEIEAQSPFLETCWWWSSLRELFISYLEKRGSERGGDLARVAQQSWT